MRPDLRNSDQRPRHCVITESYRLWSIQLSNTNLVENTGLEPVTSWLQTRRSPS